MKYLAFFLVYVMSLHAALTDSLASFEAAFEQRIVDENGHSVVYAGHVWAQKPETVRWHYETPVEKDIYISGKDVVVIEPEMEQAIIRTLREDIDFLTIISQAKKTGPDTYEAVYGSQKFTIMLQDGIIVSIAYRDTFENRIELHFSKQSQNAPIDPTTFHWEIPASYDVIK